MMNTNLFTVIDSEEAMRRKDLHLVFDDTKIPAGHIQYEDENGNKYIAKVQATSEVAEVIETVEEVETMKEEINMTVENINKVAETINTNTKEETTMKRGFMSRLKENTYAQRAKLVAEKAAKKGGEINIAVTKKVAYGQGYATATVSENMANFEIKRREEALKSYKEGVQKALEKKAERKENKVINKALANVQ